MRGINNVSRIEQDERSARRWMMHVLYFDNEHNEEDQFSTFSLMLVVTLLDSTISFCNGRWERILNAHRYILEIPKL
jgi:hypothetical protein